MLKSARFFRQVVAPWLDPLLGSLFDFYESLCRRVLFLQPGSELHVAGGNVASDPSFMEAFQLPSDPEGDQ